LNVFHTILSKLSMQDIFVPARGGVLLNYIYYMFYVYVYVILWEGIYALALGDANINNTLRGGEPCPDVCVSLSHKPSFLFLTISLSFLYFVPLYYSTLFTSDKWYNYPIHGVNSWLWLSFNSFPFTYLRKHQEFLSIVSLIFWIPRSPRIKPDSHIQQL
jgi:hypothetical protein